MGAHDSSPCSRRCRRAAFRSSAPMRSLRSSRRSVPRPVIVTSTPAGVCGSQSNVISPMVTAHPGLRAQPDQFLLDAQTCQPIGEIAHRFVVVEAGLADPALGTRSPDDEAALFVGLDGEAALVHRYRTDHRPPRHRHRPFRVVGLDHLPQPKHQRLQAFPSHCRNQEDRPAALGDLVADEFGELTRLRARRSC